MADLELEEIPSIVLDMPSSFVDHYEPLINPLLSYTEAIGRPKLIKAFFVTSFRPESPDTRSDSLLKAQMAFLQAEALSAPLVQLAETYAFLGTGRILSNQGESSGSGGRAREGRNGGGGNGNQGILGGGVGGRGQREGIGIERSNRGRNHGGGNGNGDDDGNDRRGWVGYLEGENRLAELLLFLNAQMIGTLESIDIHGLPARARIFRVVSLGFNSVAVVCLSASIGQRRTNPRLDSVLCWIGSFATLLGFISMIAMAFSASFIP